jgi:hypothetical protein
MNHDSSAAEISYPAVAWRAYRPASQVLDLANEEGLEHAAPVRTITLAPDGFTS